MLKKDLEKVNIKSPHIPYYANYTAELIDKNTSTEYIKSILSKQVSGSVRFEQSVRKLIESGFDRFIEIGPGDTLTGFVKRIAKDMKVEGLKKFENKIVLVTGAGRGIGASIAKRFASEGAEVIVNYSGNDEAAQKTVDEITATGGQAQKYKCSVNDSESVKVMIDEIIKKFGRIDILVNNAGITKDGLMLRMTDEDFDRVIDVNLKGTFNCTKYVSKYMLKQKSGKIINISSVVGLSGNAGQVNYSASKAGIIGITKSAAKELSSRGITVNAVAPGYVDTDMTKVLSDNIRNEILKNIPLQRMGNVEDISNCVAFLASEDASYITGQVISVDGGMHI